MITRNLIAITVLFSGLFVSSLSWAGDKVFSDSGIAINGYDPVAYFTDGAPIEGDPALTAQWNGVTWRFARETNRDQFVAAPEKYAPQYGGYCAWAVSQGYTASTNSDAWKIVEGKLYLNYSKSVQGRWDKDIAGHIDAGDANWPGIEEDL